MSAPAARNFPPGELRASDADRDRAISELSEHYQAGRLTVDEFQERSGLALRARTGNDLAALLADLPPALARQTSAAASAVPVAPVAATHRVPVATIALAAVAVIGVIAVLGARYSGHRAWAGLGPMLIALLILRRLGGGGWRHEHRHIHLDHHEHHLSSREQGGLP